MILSSVACGLISKRGPATYAAGPRLLRERPRRPLFAQDLQEELPHLLNGVDAPHLIGRRLDLYLGVSNPADDNEPPRLRDFREGAEREAATRAYDEAKQRYEEVLKIAVDDLDRTPELTPAK